MTGCLRRLLLSILGILCISLILVAGAGADTACPCQTGDCTCDYTPYTQTIPLCCSCPFETYCSIPASRKPNYFRADFSANIQSGGPPLTVLFQDWSFGEPDTWSWDFGDGSGSSEQNPVHTYTSPGSYTVTLTVTREYLAYNRYLKESRTVSKPGFIQVTGSSSQVQQSATLVSESSGAIPINSLIEHDFVNALSNHPIIGAHTFGEFNENVIISPLLERTAFDGTSFIVNNCNREERIGNLEDIFSKKGHTDRSGLLQLITN